jgi:hypothetical protein
MASFASSGVGRVGMPMSMLVQMLSNQTSRQVVDRTGITDYSGAGGGG